MEACKEVRRAREKVRRAREKGKRAGRAKKGKKGRLR
jgi:hypothetical protein